MEEYGNESFGTCDGLRKQEKINVTKISAFTSSISGSDYS